MWPNALITLPPLPTLFPLLQPSFREIMSIYYPPRGCPKAPGGRVLFGYHPGGNFCPREPVGTRGDPCGPRGRPWGGKGREAPPPHGLPRGPQGSPRVPTGSRGQKLTGMVSKKYPPNGEPEGMREGGSSLCFTREGSKYTHDWRYTGTYGPHWPKYGHVGPLCHLPPNPTHRI